MLAVANAYYFFSVQFRENLQIACQLYPNDCALQALRAEECDTDNLSPWRGVAEVGEKLDHDEFMRRALALPPAFDFQHDLNRVGGNYLAMVRSVDAPARAKSIASYEDGGLSKVFRAILRGCQWDYDSLQAFRHFLKQHIRFDLADGGHADLSRHLSPDDTVAPLWRAFEDILIVAAPRLAASR